MSIKVKIKKDDGLVEKGNIDLTRRPTVQNDDGSVSTVRSMGITDKGVEVLIPTVHPEGRIMSDQEAVQHYKTTGQHLGKFKTIKHSNDYAEQLHKDQEQMYGN